MLREKQVNVIRKTKKISLRNLKGIIKINKKLNEIKNIYVIDGPITKSPWVSSLRARYGIIRYSASRVTSFNICVG